MKAKSAKVKNTKSIKKPAIVPKVEIDEYFSLKDMAMCPVSEHTLNQLAVQIVNWVVQEQEVYSISAFLRDKMINWATYYRWLDRCKNLRQAHDFVLLVLGERRERLGLQRKLDSGMVSYTMAHYSPEWKSLAEWRSKLKQEAEVGTEAKVVVIEKFPDEKEKT